MESPRQRAERAGRDLARAGIHRFGKRRAAYCGKDPELHKTSFTMEALIRDSGSRETVRDSDLVA